MQHVVFFPAADGSPSFRIVAGLDDALHLVEHLRNVEQVTGASVFALTAVPLAVRAYYRVELAGAEEPVVVDAQPEAPALEQVADQEPTTPEEPVEEVAEHAPVEDAELPPLVTVGEARPRGRDGSPAEVADLGFFAR